MRGLGLDQHRTRTADADSLVSNGRGTREAGKHGGNSEAVHPSEYRHFIFPCCGMTLRSGSFALRFLWC
jgi:hypothetical protein